MLMADGCGVSFENLFGNILKYAMENTRSMKFFWKKDQVIFTLKNISAQPLNIPAEELTERFHPRRCCQKYRRHKDERMKTELITNVSMI